MVYGGTWHDVIFAGFQMPYIYHLGNEFTSLTGGWSADGYTIQSAIPINGKVQKLSKTISLTASESSSQVGVVIGVKNILDLSNYTKVTAIYSWGGVEHTLALDISSVSSGYISLTLDNYPNSPTGHIVRFMIIQSNAKNNVQIIGKYAMHKQNYSTDLLSISIKSVYFS